MSLHYHEIKDLLDEVSPHLVGSSLNNVEELGQGQFILNFGSPERSYRLFFSLVVPFVRFHQTERKGHEPHHPFIKELTSRLQGARLLSLSLLNEDRIVQLAFSNKNSSYLLIAELFSKFPNCLLLNDKKAIIATYLPTERTFYQPPEKNNFQPPLTPAKRVSSSEIEQLYVNKEAEHRFAKEKNVLVQMAKSRLNKCVKKITHLQKLLAKNQNWEEMHHLALLLQSNLYQIKRGMDSIEVFDWLTQNQRIIPLETHLEPKIQIEILFHRSKKLKLGIPHLIRQIEKNQKEENHWRQIQEQVVAIDTMEELKRLRTLQQIPQRETRARQTEKPKPKLPYRQFYSQSGLKIWVGRDAKTNDKLTFHLANGRDWWFHVSGCAGSHVILHLESQKDPDENAVLDAAQLALVYSKLHKEGKGEIIVTQKKHLQRADKNRPGEVLVSKHKIRQISLDERRLKQIKQRTFERRKEIRSYTERDSKFGFWQREGSRD